MASCSGSSGAGNDGAALFVKSYGAAGSDVIHEVTETPDGGYCFVGAYGGLEFSDTTHRYRDEDLWITKVDALGDIEWSQALANNTPTNFEQPNEYNRPNQVAPSAQGGYFVASRSFDQLAGNPEDHQVDIALEGYDDSGTPTWSLKINIPSPSGTTYLAPLIGGRDLVTSLYGTGDQGVLVGGVTYATFAESGLAIDSEFGWILKVDSTGSLDWIHYVPLDLGAGRSYAEMYVTEAEDGSIYGAQYSSQVGTWSTSNRRDQRTNLYKLTDTGLLTWTGTIDDFYVDGISVAQSPAGTHGPLMIGYDIAVGDRRGISQACLYGSDGVRWFLRDLDLKRIDTGAGIMPSGTDPGVFQFIGVSSDWEPASPSEWHSSLRVIRTNGVGQVADSDETLVQGISQAYSARVTDLTGTPRFEVLCGRPHTLGSQADLPAVVLSGLTTASPNDPFDSEANLNFTLADWEGAREAPELAGWGQAGNTFWNWTTYSEATLALGRLLTHYDSDSNEIWSRDFEPAEQRRSERALGVAVLSDSQTPGDWKLGVYGQSDISLGVNPGEEETYPWFVTVSPEGTILTETLYDGASLGAVEVGGEDPGSVPYFGQFNRSRWLDADTTGNAFIVMELGNLPHVAKVNGAGGVVWCSVPLVVNADNGNYGVIALDDGGALAMIGSVIVRLDDAGGVTWRKHFEQHLTLAWALGSDGQVAVLLADTNLLIQTLDLDGNKLWESEWEVPGESLTFEGARLEGTADGGFLAMIRRTLPSGLTASLIQASNMIELFKFDRDGVPQWRNSYGGLLNDFGFGVSATRDGGILVGGSTSSITESTDGWLMRLDSCGQSGSLCVAEFERQDANFNYSVLPFSAGSSLTDYTFPVAFEVAGTPNPISAAAFQLPLSNLLVTRQCNGVSKDQPVAPSETYFELTILVNSGEGSVTQVDGAGAGLTCENSCTYSYPVGTTIQLSATPFTGFLTPSWTGGDCGGGVSSVCSVTMDGPRTVLVDFPPEGDYNGLLDLNVIIQGSGSGSVLVSPPFFSITESFLFEDLSAQGDSHTLTVTPGPGSSFGGFTGCDSVDGNEGYITFGTTNRTVTVTFN